MHPTRSSTNPEVDFEALEVDEVDEELTFGDMVDQSAESTDLAELYEEHDGL